MQPLGKHDCMHFFLLIQRIAPLERARREIRETRLPAHHLQHVVGFTRLRNPETYFPPAYAPVRLTQDGVDFMMFAKRQPLSRTANFYISASPAPDIAKDTVKTQKKSAAVMDG